MRWQEVLAATFAGLYDVCRASFRLPEGSIKKRVYTEDLVFLKIPDEFVVDIVSAVFGERCVLRASRFNVCAFTLIACDVRARKPTAFPTGRCHCMCEAARVCGGFILLSDAFVSCCAPRPPGHAAFFGAVAKLSMLLPTDGG